MCNPIGFMRNLYKNNIFASTSTNKKMGVSLLQNILLLLYQVLQLYPSQHLFHAHEILSYI